MPRVDSVEESGLIIRPFQVHLQGKGKHFPHSKAFQGSVVGIAVYFRDFFNSFRDELKEEAALG